MSHFGVLVVVDRAVDRDMAESAARPLLAPYAMDLEVDSYEIECPCVEERALVAAFMQFDVECPDWRATLDATLEDAQHNLERLVAAGRGEIEEEQLLLADVGTRVDLMVRWGFDPPASVRHEEDRLSRAVQELVQQRESRIAALVAAEKKRQDADIDCEICHGDGVTRTTRNPDTKWDWYQIGGRWTGTLDSDYDPTLDPANMTRCRICGGSGVRNDLQQAERCAACDGVGIDTVSPAHWRRFPRDVRPVAELNAREVADMFAAVVTADGVWHARRQTGDFGNPEILPLDLWAGLVDELITTNSDTYAIVVDCHL